MKRKEKWRHKIIFRGECFGKHINLSRNSERLINLESSSQAISNPPPPSSHSPPPKQANQGPLFDWKQKKTKCRNKINEEKKKETKKRRNT